MDHTAATRRLNRNDYRTLSLAALGGALEFYDFIIFIFFASTMGHVFFPPNSPGWLVQVQTYAVFAAGYLARPLGGILMAHFGDLNGRKRMFTLSIFLMALPTFVMGLLPSYHSIGLAAPALLLLLRVLQGAAIGGEVPGAWVFVAEHSPARRVGFACGTLTAGLTSGILLGSLVASAMHAYYSPEELINYAWRIPFLLGGVFGLASVYLRGYLHETPIFKEMQAQKTLAQAWPLKAVLLHHRGAVLVSMLLTWLLTAAIVVVILMTPAWLSTLPGISTRDALLANSLAVLCLSFGCVLVGHLLDRFDAGRVLILGSLLLAGASYGFYSTMTTHPHWLFTAYAGLGLCVGIVSAVPYVMVRAFPPMVRFSGLSFSYNVAYAIFGGLTPITLALLLRYHLLAPAHYVATISLIGVVIGIYLTIKPRSVF